VKERRRIITGEEEDVHTRWRHYLTSYQRAGKASKAKRRTRRRERREGRAEASQQLND
jgi:hypothetical protein